LGRRIYHRSGHLLNLLLSIARPGAVRRYFENQDRPQDPVLFLAGEIGLTVPQCQALHLLDWIVRFFNLHRVPQGRVTKHT
jgi:hypothetical protein